MGFGGGWASVILLCVVMPIVAARGVASSTQQQTAPDQGPALSHRPPPPGAPQGKIQLDVLVTDSAGQPVAGLQQQDFTLIDNKKPQPILSFRAVDGTTGQVSGGQVSGMGQRAPDPPVEVILLMDATNNSLHNIAYERDQIAKFLRQNDGRLAQPVTLMVFAEQGVKVQPQPSKDGNMIALSLEKSDSPMHIVPRSGGYDAIERTQLSLKTLGMIAAAETPKPGRKMLIWVGPGWPMLQGVHYQMSDNAQRSLFNLIVGMTRALREARITMYHVNQADPGALARLDYYKDFLKGVPSANRVEPGDAAVPVFAVHSGGLVENRSDELIQELNRCIAEAKAYYTLSFDPPSSEHTDEYHELQVKVDKPNLKARTNAGYYSEPTPKP